MAELTWLEKANAAGVEGFCHPNELEKLVDLATGKDVLEIGSFKGLSAWCMAHTAKSVMCVDTFRANSAGQDQQEALTTYDAFMQMVSQWPKPNITHFIGTSEEANDFFRCGNEPNADYDLIFLDAMHDYESVKADIERWWPRLRPGGVMAFHDYGHDHFPGRSAGGRRECSGLLMVSAARRCAVGCYAAVGGELKEP
jgi:predicted O-methyltransferase YrrM